MSFIVTRKEADLSKGISLVRQYHDFVPYKLGDEISFELTSQDRISAKAVCRKNGGMLFCANHPLSVSGSVCHAMNDDVTNTDGYIFSDLRNYLNSAVIDLFPKDIRNELVPFANGDCLRIPTYDDIFGKCQAGLPSKRWNCMMHQENRILKRKVKGTAFSTSFLYHIGLLHRAAQTSSELSIMWTAMATLRSVLLVSVIVLFGSYLS